jgi:hypothetical protein
MVGCRCLCDRIVRNERLITFKVDRVSDFAG